MRQIRCQFICFILLAFTVLFTTNSAIAVEAENPLATKNESESEMQAEAKDFSSVINALSVKGFKAKTKAITELMTATDPRTIDVMQATREGRLFYIKENKRVVTTVKVDGEYHLNDAISGESLGTLPKGKLKKISANNKLRKQLGGAIARLSLSHTDSDVRLSAVTEINKNLNAESVTLLRKALTTESDDDVLDVINTGIALSDLNSADKSARLKAIETLSDNLHPATQQKLNALVEKNDQGQYIETDSDIRKAARAALTNIEGQVAFFGFVETAFFGLSLGSVLLLIAIGLAITFGVMGVINMAHGELMMIGAYTTYLVQAAMPNYIDYSLLVAVPSAFVIAGLFGIAIERGVIRHLYGRPLETLLATFGISFDFATTGAHHHLRTKRHRFQSQLDEWLTANQSRFIHHL